MALKSFQSIFHCLLAEIKSLAFINRAKLASVFRENVRTIRKDWKSKKRSFPFQPGSML
jgi:hypothetical protein